MLLLYVPGQVKSVSQVTKTHNFSFLWTHRKCDEIGSSIGPWTRTRGGEVRLFGPGVQGSVFPGSGGSWGNLAVLPESKEAESQSTFSVPFHPPLHHQLLILFNTQYDLETCYIIYLV